MSLQLSVIISAYNEEGNIGKLIDRVREALVGFSYEIIIVDDGSFDGTADEVLSRSRADLVFVRFAKNYGQTAALAAGIATASGEFCVTLDGDLQNDPSDIPAMLKYLQENKFDMVVGWRKNRKDNAVIRKLPSKIANYLIRRLTKVKVHDLGCALKIIKAPLAKSLNLYGEMHRYISLLAFWQGAKIGELEVKHHPRNAGKSKYGLNRTLNVISDVLFLTFSERYINKPIHFFGRIGFYVFSIGVVIGGYLLYEKILGHDIGTRPLVSLFVLFTLMGALFFVLGFVTEFLSKIYYEQRKGQIYDISEVRRFE